MAVTCVTSLTLTTKPDAMPANTVFTHGSNLLLLDVSTTAATEATLHRWSEEFQRWIASAAGKATLPGTAGAFETRWDIGGVSAKYCVLTDAAATCQPHGAQ